MVMVRYLDMALDESVTRLYDPTQADKFKRNSVFAMVVLTELVVAEMAGGQDQTADDGQDALAPITDDVVPPESTDDQYEHPHDAEDEHGGVLVTAATEQERDAAGRQDHPDQEAVEIFTREQAAGQDREQHQRERHQQAVHRAQAGDGHREDIQRFLNVRVSI